MKVIFGTTNARKVEDLQNIVDSLNADIEVLSLEDINWDLPEIEENGTTLEENSLIKANAILDFCQKHNISYPIITDDSGLFVESLDGRPGIYTARYADEERKNDPTLPKYQCVIKLLDEMKEITDRSAYYRCAVTVMYPNGEYFQETAKSNGTIAKDIIGELKKPYFYSVFILDGYNVAFSNLSKDELKDTYRQKALSKVIPKINK